MTRLHMFVEGTTEQVFADTVLKPHLANRGAYLHKPVLVAHARKKGHVHRGGGRRFRPMQNDIERRLKEDASADMHFTTMVDLYALYCDFPRKEKADELRARPYDRVAALEAAWQEETDDRRFIPFIQLHEFEAYLFVGVARFPEFCDSSRGGVAQLQRVADSMDSPELIDDGQHSAPSKRIIEQIPAYKRLKTSVGPQMAADIGLRAIRLKCPHFDAWISRLEGLGGG